MGLIAQSRLPEHLTTSNNSPGIYKTDEGLTLNQGKFLGMNVE